MHRLRMRLMLQLQHLPSWPPQGAHNKSHAARPLLAQGLIQWPR